MILVAAYSVKLNGTSVQYKALLRISRDRSEPDIHRFAVYNGAVLLQLGCYPVEVWLVYIPLFRAVGQEIDTAGPVAEGISLKVTLAAADYIVLFIVKLYRYLIFLIKFSGVFNRDM